MFFEILIILYFCLSKRKAFQMEINVFVILALGIFLAFFIQTVVGFAGTLVGLPILLLVIDLPDAIAYMSIFYFISSPVLVYKEWKNIDKQIIIRLALSSIIGIAVGVWLLTFDKPIFLKKALGVFILCYVVYSFYKDKKFKIMAQLEYVFGFLGGFFSGVFSTGGPLYVVVVKNTAVDMQAFRATMFGILGFVTLIRVPMLGVGGILNSSHIYYSLFVLPFFGLGLILGNKMHKKLNEDLLKKCILILLLCSGFALMLKS